MNEQYFDNIWGCLNLGMCSFQYLCYVDLMAAHTYMLANSQQHCHIPKLTEYKNSGASSNSKKGRKRITEICKLFSLLNLLDSQKLELQSGSQMVIFCWHSTSYQQIFFAKKMGQMLEWLFLNVVNSYTQCGKTWRFQAVSLPLDGLLT